MPISVKINCDRHRASSEVTGESTSKSYGPIFELFGMDKDDVLAAIKTIDSRFTNFMLFDHKTTCTPVDDRVIEDQEDLLDLGTKTFKNNTSRTASSKVGHSVNKTNKIAVTWSNQNQVTKGWNIGLSINVGGSCKSEGSYHKSLTTTTGEDVQKSEEISVGSDCEMRVDIPPGKTVVATLRAVRRIIKVNVTYNVDVCGNIAGVYGTERQPQTLKISDVIRAAGKSNSLRFTETIKIDCYTNAIITLDD